MRPRNLKFFLYINPYGYSLQTKFHVPRSHTFREKCDDNLKLASHFSPILCDRGTWNFFCILTHMDTLCKPNFMFAHYSRPISVRKKQLFRDKHALKFYKLASHFSPILCDRGTWNFFCILTHMDTLCKPNFMFLGLHTFREKCDDNLKLASHFSPILCDRGTWNFFCILTHMDTLCKPNFMFLGRTLFEKNAMITCKNSKLHNCPNKQLWNFTS